MSIGSPNSPIRIENSTLNKKKRGNYEIDVRIGGKDWRRKKKNWGSLFGWVQTWEYEGGFRGSDEEEGRRSVVYGLLVRAALLGSSQNLLTISLLWQHKFYLGKTFLEFATHTQNLGLIYSQTTSSELQNYSFASFKLDNFKNVIIVIFFLHCSPTFFHSVIWYLHLFSSNWDITLYFFVYGYRIKRIFFIPVVWVNFHFHFVVLLFTT